MDAAKSSINKFMESSGKHDTEVHETHAPAVTKNEVAHHQHENMIPAVNKEIHQHHYQTSVQPISHSETLAEQHHNKELPTEFRTHQHGDEEDDKRRVAANAAQFKDEERHVEGNKTSGSQPVVTGEHRHHHVHHTVQPVVHKQTVQPHVVHTTAPVHETHHNASHHHEGKEMPSMSMADFTKGGGVLTGRDTQSNKYEGEPRWEGEGGNTSSATRSAGTTGTTGTSGLGSSNTYDRDASSRTAGTSGLGDSSASRTAGTTGTSGLGDSSRTAGTTGTSGLGDSSRTAGTTGTSGLGDSSSYGRDARDATSGSTGDKFGTMDGGSRGDTSGYTDSSTSGSKPSLMDRLNPKKDTTGDGVAGFMK